jgi:predicted phage tail protein
MVEEKAKKTGRSIALSGFIGFVLVALLVGMMIGGYLTLFVIAPQMQTIQQTNNNQETT